MRYPVDCIYLFHARVEFYLPRVLIYLPWVPIYLPWYLSTYLPRILAGEREVGLVRYGNRLRRF